MDGSGWDGMGGLNQCIIGMSFSFGIYISYKLKKKNAALLFWFVVRRWISTWGEGGEK